MAKSKQTKPVAKPVAAVPEPVLAVMRSAKPIATKAKLPPSSKKSALVKLVSTKATQAIKAPPSKAPARVSVPAQTAQKSSTQTQAANTKGGGKARLPEPVKVPASAAGRMPVGELRALVEKLEAANKKLTGEKKDLRARVRALEKDLAAARNAESTHAVPDQAGDIAADVSAGEGAEQPAI